MSFWKSCLASSLLLLGAVSAFAADDPPDYKLVPELGGWWSSTIPDLTAAGTVTGSSVASTNLVSCNTIDTDANGNFVCGTDSGGGGNSFETIAVPAGASVVADSSTDTLTLTETSFLTLTGTAATDTIDITQVTTDLGTDGLIAANAVALGTDTTNAYVTDLTAGTYIDVSGGGAETANVTVTVDATEIEAVTFGAGGNATNAWTMNLSGTDPVMTWGSNTVTGPVVAASTAIELNGDRITDFTGTGLIQSGGTLTPVCASITGSADLCDGSDATGAGGGDPVLIDGVAVTDGSGVDLQGGTNGIDIAFNAGASPDTARVDLDVTELVGSQTFSDASTDTMVWTWNRATGTDPTLTFGNNTVTGLVVAASTALEFSDTIRIDTNGIRVVDGELVNLSAINTSSTTEGFLLPQSTSCASGTAEGQACWDTDQDQYYVGKTGGVVPVGSFILGATSSGSQTADHELGLWAGQETEITPQPIPMQISCTNFYARVGTAPGAGNQWVVTAQLDDAATALSCTISETAVQCGPDTDVVTWAVDEEMDFLWDETGTPTGSEDEGISMQCWPS